MNISENEIKIILNKGNFLINMGYKVSCSEYIITYTKDALIFRITFEPYGDISSVSVVFKETNEEFNIGWIAFVRDNVKVNSHEKINNVIVLLQYIDEHYGDIIKYEFCKDSEKLVDDFIQKQRAN